MTTSLNKPLGTSFITRPVFHLGSIVLSPGANIRRVLEALPSGAPGYDLRASNLHGFGVAQVPVKGSQNSGETFKSGDDSNFRSPSRITFFSRSRYRRTVTTAALPDSYSNESCTVAAPRRCPTCEGPW